MNNITLKRTKGDIIVIIAAVSLIIAMLIALFSVRGNKENNVVTVKYDNQVIHTMHLNIDETFTMKQADYDKLLGDLVIVVEDGAVRVDEQTSHYNYCEYMGPVSQKGTSIICAPNSVVITIDGYEDTGVDWQGGGK